MKKILKVFSIVTVILASFAFSSALAVTADVQINGEIIDFTDAEGNKVDAQLINSRTMVPLRKIFEVLGCEIEWNGDTQTVTATKEEKEIILQINNTNATIKENGVEETIKLDTAPVIMNNRTLVPLRFIAESLEKQVGWDSSSYTAIIIDYDYFADLIKQNNPSLYQLLTTNHQNISFSVTQNYIDNSNTSLNTTAILSGAVRKNGDISEVTLEFSGTAELMKEIASEGWNHIVYEAQYNGNKINVKTTNEVFQKMLNLNANTYTEFDVEKMNLIGKSENTLAQAIESLFDIKDSQLNASTFEGMKTEFNTFLNLFVTNGTRTLNYDNAKMQKLDYTRFDNIIYGNEMVRTLAFINQNVFHYDVLQDELLYDWNSINYSLSSENNTLVLKITLENEYNEKVEYIVECK